MFEVFRDNSAVNKFNRFDSATRWVRNKEEQHPEVFEIAETNGELITRLWKFNTHTKKWQRWDIDRDNWFLKF